jgi:microcystin-dependent protein
MSEPFLAEIRIVGFNFAPRGWAFCDGQILPINQNQSLYSLLGTTYGGDGRTSFALPDLRSRTPIHMGDGYRLGQKSGAETVTLTAAQIAAHTHTVKASSIEGDQRDPTGRILASPFPTPPDLQYRDPEAANITALRSGTIANAGGGQAHNNMQPYTTLNYCIALQGLFPSRN